ncbi:TIR domain-containing adapter molecule 1 [Toxotes jaculatrix]|uniref:TIR domain-containing adapter molecule 1 n=1 Tax=Toxotes jaculatrix TaxID=941984 RepID=UPI001B3AA20E|nr:TIR domain-containing adapter molecule 1 [Toxotes jaculatrix]XP_040912108.1 TIR domain-containing adapter molecule 1 [Toxotes jaculatrix]XP_040912109.1 TIR domain-containing adapter molecule 1 [Toxotes jaculatrix]
MTHEGQENQGTGLKDVFDILVKESPERLLSLTIQLGESPEDNIINALCLIILQREAQALNKLQMLKDNYLANHLAERWKMSGGKLGDFAVQCGHFQEFTGESLTLLARIFKVLSERRLCDPLLRNLAYQKALSSDSQKTSSIEDLEYDQLREEAKVVCGPQFEEWSCSSRDLKSGSHHETHRSLDEGKTTLKIPDKSGRVHSLPSALQSSSSMPSYPTHLEISIPPTASFQGDKISPETSDKSKPNSCVLLAPGQSPSSEESQPKSNEPTLLEAKVDAAECKKDGHVAQNETPSQNIKPSSEPKFALPTATNSFVPKVSIPNEIHESKGTEEETFYAFVIMHAAEDADMAESMREKLERVTGYQGATFCDDFAIPGKSTLRCVEDAINSSAYTILLLTRNFNTRMEEMKTDSALINSITKKHKYNTVIPLLPQENAMPKQSLPLVLQTMNPLDESRNFEKKIKMFLRPAKIEEQKRIWAEEQRMKSQVERQDELKRLNQRTKELIQECKKTQSLERESLDLLMTQKLVLNPNMPPGQEGGDGRSMWQQQPQNIHIENAKYIMIGNDSQMTVDYCGATNKDDSLYSDEEQ